MRIEPFQEHMFFPMDIYNDSAEYALRVLKQQFLYVETQAETLNLFSSFEISLFYEILLLCLFGSGTTKSKQKPPSLFSSFEISPFYEILHLCVFGSGTTKSRRKPICPLTSWPTCYRTRSTCTTRIKQRMFSCHFHIL